MNRQQRADVFRELVRQIDLSTPSLYGWHMLELADIALSVAEHLVQEEHGTRLPSTDAGIALMRDARQNAADARNVLYYVAKGGVLTLRQVVPAEQDTPEPEG